MKLSIIVCTRNRLPVLRETLEAIHRVEPPIGLEVESLVVDNGSADGTGDFLARWSSGLCGRRYVREATPGKGHAYNRALAEASGEFLLFADDDVLPKPGWISGMLSPLVSGKSHAVAGGVEVAPHLLRSWMTKRHRVALASTEDLDPVQPDQMIGANMAFSREVLRKVPKFDVELGPGSPFGFGEETVFSMQVIEAGYRLRGALDVKVEHHPDQSRLKRAAWLDYARKSGQSNAYTDYHWRHNEPDRIRRRKALARAKLLRRRILHFGEMKHDEYCPHWEISLRSELAYYDQLAIERTRPRNYEKRGLVKLGGKF